MKSTYLQKCQKLFRGASHISKQHYATTTGPVGIIFDIWRTFKGRYISQMAQDGKWPQNAPEYDLNETEWAKIFADQLSDKLKAEIESWD